jgi:hypothetical protein
MPSQVDEKVDFVTFEQTHQPTLAVGDYEITVEQAVSITGRTDKADFPATRYFTVAGERFELKPADVHSVFPPDGNLGRHHNVLPHIILNRSTLPWERTAEWYPKGEAKQVTGVPWLALLLFDEDQKPAPLMVSAGKLEDPPATPRFRKIELESAQKSDDQVTVIDVPQRVLKAIMPAIDELKLLAHARFGSDDKGDAVGDELAIIIANRLPKPGKTSTAHLVSLEGRFEKGTVSGDPQKYGFSWGPSNDELIRLISLKSWTFACEQDKKGFKELLLELNQRPDSIGTLRLPRSSAENVEKLLAKGYVALRHCFRHGDETASFFHGPFMPGKNTSAVNLPARSPDELLRYDTDIAMFDVSYAAAWELGRLLALQDKELSTGLYQWKRRQAQQRAQKLQRVAHLPFQKELLGRTAIPKPIAAWFDNLRQLKGVPFNYLVPDERMLPPESIRFFCVDGAWIDCLADGAFSIGRVTSSDHNTDKLLGAKNLSAAAVAASGFLLRSEVVSGWPALQVEAYSEQKQEIGLLRKERLSAGVLLCLFAGEIARVDIHQKPETLHFGLDESSQGSFSKSLRDPKGKKLDGKEVKVIAEHWRPNPNGNPDPSQRTLNVAVLARSMKQELNPTAPPLTSAQFGLQMVEGVERIIFSRKSA